MLRRVSSAYSSEKITLACSRYWVSTDSSHDFSKIQNEQQQKENSKSLARPSNQNWPDLKFEITTLSSHTDCSVYGKLLDAVKGHRIHLTSPDIFSICTTTMQNGDKLGLLKDSDFMRAIGDAFASSDQSVLGPFQVNTVVEVLRRVGVLIQPSEVMVPEEEEAITPQSLIHVLRSMSVNKNRDERKINQVVESMNRLLEEFTASDGLEAIHELSVLKYEDGAFTTKLAKVTLKQREELTTSDFSTMIKNLSTLKGVTPVVLHEIFQELESRFDDFELQDYRNVLEALLKLGPMYGRHFDKLVMQAGIDRAESLDALTLTAFLTAFTQIDYKKREHIDILADALVDVLSDLTEDKLVEAALALQHLDLLDESIFEVINFQLMRFSPTLAPKLVPSVVDLCSVVPYNSTALMDLLLIRIGECVRFFSAIQLGNLLEALGGYGAAKDRVELVEGLAKQCYLRLEIMHGVSAAKAVKGLTELGYRNAEFYLKAADCALRYGVNNWKSLEPILVGLSLSPDDIPMPIVKQLASHTAQLARTLTLQEVQQAHKCLAALHCEEDYVYRALSARVLHFVKEITADVPEDIQVLLQRGALNAR